MIRCLLGFNLVHRIPHGTDRLLGLRLFLIHSPRVVCEFWILESAQSAS